MSEPTNEERSEWAEMAVIAFSQAAEGTNGFELYDAPEAVLGDLLADLMHYADAYELDFKAALKTATMNYRAEFTGDLDRSRN